MSPLTVVTSSYPRWLDDSAGRFVAASVDGLRQAGLDVQVIAPKHPQSQAQGGVRWVPYAPHSAQDLCFGDGIWPNLRQKPRRILQAPSLVLRLAQALRQKPARPVLAHWLVPAGLSALLADVQRLVVIVHGSDLALLERLPIGALLARRISAHAQGLIFVSEELRQRFIHLTGKAEALGCLKVLPPTTFAPVLLPRDRALASLWRAARETKIILFVGRLIPSKGVSVLLRALAEMKTKTSCYIVGSGPDLAPLQAQSQSLGLSARLRFLGPLPPAKLGEIFAAADLLILPSRPDPGGHAEGFPTVLIEAMASALPIVASRVGGVAEHLVDGHNARLVQANNPQALAQVIQTLLDDPQRRKQLAGQARVDVQTLLPKAHGQRLTALLQDFWSEKKG